jgi:hypothetical protein
MDWMMGSLLVIKEGARDAGLPSGEQCSEDKKIGGMDGVGTAGKNVLLTIPTIPAPDNPDRLPTFDPKNTSIGDTVKWVWVKKSYHHPITSDTGIWDPGKSDTGPYSRVFKNPGGFPYYYAVTTQTEADVFGLNERLPEKNGLKRMTQ